MEHPESASGRPQRITKGDNTFNPQVSPMAPAHDGPRSNYRTGISALPRSSACCLGRPDGPVSGCGRCACRLARLLRTRLCPRRGRRPLDGALDPPCRARAQAGGVTEDHTPSHVRSMRLAAKLGFTELERLEAYGAEQLAQCRRLRRRLTTISSACGRYPHKAASSRSASGSRAGWSSASSPVCGALVMSSAADCGVRVRMSTSRALRSVSLRREAMRTRRGARRRAAGARFPP
jgi:hypothetical protein